MPESARPRVRAALEIRPPRTPAEQEAYYRFRWQHLRAPWGQPPGSERDEQEEQAVHAMALRDAELVGVGRLHRLQNEEGGGRAQIRYMAVAPALRGQGIGRALLDWLETRARASGVKTLCLAAREESAGFYRRLGYRDCGPGHTLFGEIRHRKMEKEL